MIVQQIYPGNGVSNFIRIAGVIWKILRKSILVSFSGHTVEQSYWCDANLLSLLFPTGTGDTGAVFVDLLAHWPSLQIIQVSPVLVHSHSGASAMKSPVLGPHG